MVKKNAVRSITAGFLAQTQNPIKTQAGGSLNRSEGTFSIHVRWHFRVLLLLLLPRLSDQTAITRSRFISETIQAWSLAEEKYNPPPSVTLTLLTDPHNSWMGGLLPPAASAAAVAAAALERSGDVCSCNRREALTCFTSLACSCGGCVSFRHGSSRC